MSNQNKDLANCSNMSNALNSTPTVKKLPLSSHSDAATPPSTTKEGFIKARLNKDNFWNLMFWLGICLGSILSAFFHKIDWSKCAFITSWLTILGVPYIVKSYSNITFTEDKICLNHEGKPLNSRCPNMFWFIILNFAAMAFIGSLFDEYAQNISKEVSSIVLFLIISFLPVLWFILKNCPISILFYKKAWCLEITKTSGDTNHLPEENPNTSLSYYYRHWGGNVHNPMYKK